MSQKNTSDWQLLLRSIVPSAGSMGGSFFLALLIIGFHMLLLSRETDLLLPHFTGVFSDQMAEIYAAEVLAPLDRIFGNSLFGVAMTALVWGAVGWLIYAVLEYTIGLVKEWRQNESDVSYRTSSAVVRHPLQRQFIVRNLWRFLLSVMLITFTISIQPFISQLLQQDILLLRSGDAPSMLRHVAIAVGGWMLIFHAYVVLFRLFVFRTRVFGEIIY